MSRNLRRSIVISVAAASTVAVVLVAANKKRQEGKLPGKWCHLSLVSERSGNESSIELLDNGLLNDGDVSSTWSYFNGEVTMSPQSAPDTVYILSNEGRRLTGKVVKDFVYEKRP